MSNTEIPLAANIVLNYGGRRYVIGDVINQGRNACVQALKRKSGAGAPERLVIKILKRMPAFEIFFRLT